MRAQEFITEGATSVLYHYTNSTNAAKILTSGEFILSNTAGNPSEQQYAPNGYPYFLSTTRSKVGDYHRWVGMSAAMFVLDGNKIGQRYPVKPIDYWERSWQHSPDRTREAEDRVFSKTSTIPIDSVTSVHVLITSQDSNRSPLTRTILISAKKQGIKTYLYTDENAWRLQDTRKTVSPGEIAHILKGAQPTGRMQRPVRGINGYGRSSLMDWIELIKKQPGQPLTKTADKMRYNIRYYGDMAGQLKNDLFNAKKPDSNEYELGVKIQEFMSKNNFNIGTLMDHLKSKWSNPTAESLEEVAIDNQKGAGAVPHNADIDYFGLRVLMRPSMFLKLATPLGEPIDPKFEKYISDGGAIGAPFLEVYIPQEWDDGKFDKPARVAQHDGRNRMTIVQKQEGNAPIEVHILPRGGYRARDLTPEYVAALNQHLYAQGSDNIVRGPLFAINRTI